MSNHLLTIRSLNVQDGICPGYLVTSTAPINVEDRIEEDILTEPRVLINDIAQHLRDHADDAEILVLTHGYNTDCNGANTWYVTACEYLRDKYCDRIPKGLVVVGYRWSSEKFSGDESGSFWHKAMYTLNSIPLIMGVLLAVSIVISLFSVFMTPLRFLLVLTIPIILFIVTLIILRLTVYFRDIWRANHYGVPDLVELVRQLDLAIVENTDHTQPKKGAEYWKNKRIRLSFIGHSMGAFVTTNAVRILSDVFDQDSIGSLSMDTQNKTPSPDIGNVFRLSKLVLIAPDIPVDTIISGRANTLRSSLRRFEEAYLFVNKHDTVLKLASTIANYFSFPAKTREGGYRLGNVFICAKKVQNDLGRRYKTRFGIVNLDTVCSTDIKRPNYLDYLCISRDIPLSRRQDLVSVGGRAIAELFTCFDCTNYTEINRKTGKEVGIVSYGFGRPSKRFGERFSRIFSTKNLDSHGGYIYNDHADLSKRLIYGLACLGFKGCLQAMHPELSNSAATLSQVHALSEVCQERGMQVLLATERYEVDILCEDRDRNGY
ncbi:alpha/beta hydrolase [Myxacorys almedinensis]|uniref:Alpha/beta hydrolase n=1 Tax=Myxacorys almedinensis A TaxID=2690445 RepID=A0A8J8CID8_9CYAN|nr:alpha/beta hydrolase [Myxacorys almedinensis]NDJ16386.1 alpha/beta hydrolase [Myxacorys almedinensis A]